LDDNEVEPAEEYELSDDEIDAKENRSSNGKFNVFYSSKKR